MKKLNYILPVLIVLLLFGGCRKKDYPKDIPDWLKERIEKTEEYPGASTNEHIVEEYKLSSNQNTIFFWATYNMEWGRSYFDYDGNLLCSNSGGYSNENANPLNDTLCANLNTSQLVFVREIWHYSYSDN